MASAGLGTMVWGGPAYMAWYSGPEVARYMEMSSVSLEEEWTDSVSRGYGEAAARARM